MQDQDDRFEDTIDQYLAMSANAAQHGNNHDMPSDRTDAHHYVHEPYDYQNNQIRTDSSYSQSEDTLTGTQNTSSATTFAPMLPNFVATADPQYLYNYQTKLYYDVLSDTYSRLDEATMMYQVVSAKDAAQTHEYYSNEPSTNDTLRLVVLKSQLLPVHNIILVDANGITIGRDRSWDRRLRLPEMAVSKYHCHIFSNTADIFQDDEYVDMIHNSASNFSIIDVGSQNGTFVNGERLSLTKSASSPRPLCHLDVLSVGTTKFQVHDHGGSWPCEHCKSQNGNVIDIATTTQPKTVAEEPEIKRNVNQYDRERSRREELRRLKQKYSDGKPNRADAGYVDRADARRKQHAQSRDIEADVEPIPAQQTSGVNVKIGADNVGNRLLQKMGWKEGQGLGTSGSGILNPIQAQFREGRAGLGSPQPEEPYSAKNRGLQMARQRYNELL
ncbi:hypothetical protein Unana1_08208 [Umbelopsis nana]